MEVGKNMTASDKIEEAKNCFKGISESGKNNFQKFTYFETKDIFPVVRKVCKQFNLKTKFNWDTETNVMTLIVTDRDDNSSEEYDLPVAVPNDAKAGNFMQSIGSIQTYAMRYLYIQCFEITIPDEIDNKDNRPKQIQQNQQKKQKNTSLQKQDKKDSELLKLMFVGVTRAKHSLTLSFSDAQGDRINNLTKYLHHFLNNFRKDI